MQIFSHVCSHVCTQDINVMVLACARHLFSSLVWYTRDYSPLSTCVGFLDTDEFLQSENEFCDMLV